MSEMPRPANFVRWLLTIVPARRPNLACNWAMSWQTLTSCTPIPAAVDASSSSPGKGAMLASSSSRSRTAGSFDRWRPQRVAVSGSADAVFAEQLATNDLVPISSSPIRGTSLTTLVAQGSAWSVAGADMMFHSPLQGLGILVLSEIGLTIAAVSRAGRETLAIAVKYRLRERLGIPSDWEPPRIVNAFDWSEEAVRRGSLFGQTESPAF